MPTVEDYQKKISSLRKQVGALTILASLCGGGGAFGVVKWLAADKALTKAQTERTNAEVAKTLAETKLTEAEARQKVLEVEIAKLNELEKQLSAVQDELEKQKLKKQIGDIRSGMATISLELKSGQIIPPKNSTGKGKSPSRRGGKPPSHPKAME